jgi:hypothetical protein
VPRGIQFGRTTFTFLVQIRFICFMSHETENFKNNIQMSEAYRFPYLIVRVIQSYNIYIVAFVMQEII